MRSRLVAIAAVLALGMAGCGDDFDATCRAKRGRVDVTWNAVEGAANYRVYRIVDGQMVPAEDTSATTFVDSPTDDRVGHDYVILPLAADGSESREAMAACNAPAVDRDGGAGPDAVADLTCRAKSGKVDLAWTPVDGAASYQVLRSGTGDGQSQIGDVATPAFADIGLVNGVTYRYAVVAVDAAGESADSSNEVTCMPVARGEGTPPPVVAAPACRAKNDKVDVTWTPVEGAAYYRIARATPGETPVVVGEVIGSVFADFGLPLDVAQNYAVISVSATGAEAEASAVCDVTPRGRGDVEPNLPPVFLTDPLTSALEEHLYYDTHVTRDPEQDAVTLSLVVAPGGMQLVPETGYVSWTPVAAQVGTQAVEVRATDARGAFASRVFLIAVEAFDRPPRITSIPVREGRSGEAYLYDVEAWDANGDALTFGFAASSPPGMTIDPTTGAIAWTPTQDDAGDREVSVRVSDPAGHFDSQTWQLGIAADPILLAAPNGTFTVRAGETLELLSESNYARARYFAKPLPANATFEGNRFRFTPTAAQVGRYEIGFYASFAGRRAQNPVTVLVTRDNLPPVFGAIGAASVREGESLNLPVSATDPDGDAVIVSAPGLAIENAYFDEVNGELSFRPSFEQAGSYEVTFEANDGSAAVQRSVAITVEEAEPPVDALALTVDPPQSPTFVARQTLRGSVTGEVSSTPPPPAALVTGMTPTNVAQGRSEQVTLTGLRTAFAPGATQVTFGAGITVEQVEVLSPTSLRARIAVAANADVGIRAVRVQQGGDEVPSVVAFRVEQGASAIRGRLVDSFTGQPLVGARVTLNGTQLFTETDAEGNFVLEGAPPGDGVLVITSQNYEVVRADVAVVANQAVDLGDAIGVDALARPSTPPGSLPRAATVASVLDRGLGSKDGGLSQEDAEALVADAYLALQSKDVGILDETGAQLNPIATGNGILSLKPEGITDLARRWREGHVTDLGELADMINGAFLPLRTRSLLLESVIDGIQRAVDAAWADPSAPDSILPILLFNEGTSLSQQPPILTIATSLNAVQSHMLVTSYIVANFGALNLALDNVLEAAGIDPDTLAEPAFALPTERYADDERFGSRFDAFWSSLRDVFGGAVDTVGDAVVQKAHAQESGTGAITPPNGSGPRRNILGDTMWAQAQSFWSIFVGTLANAAIAAAFTAALLGLFAMVTGGAFLTAVTGGLVFGALMSGIVVGFFGKLWAITTGPETRVALTPEPPSIESFLLPEVDGVQRVAIVFERSPSDLAAEQNSAERFLPYIPAVSEVVDLVGPGINPQFLEFEYHLWRYGSLEAAGINEGTFVTDLSLPLPDDPTSRQFLLRADSVPEGRSFYRVVAVQYYDSFWTRNIFAWGERDVYPLSATYQDFGMVVPEGIPAGAKDWLTAPATAVGSENVDAAVTRSRTALNDARVAYEQQTASVNRRIAKQQGRLREFNTLLEQQRARMQALRDSWPEIRRQEMRRHIDVIDEVSRHIATSFASGVGAPEAAAALRNPGHPLYQRLQSLLGPEVFEQSRPFLERTVSAEVQLRGGAAVQLRQQETINRIQDIRQDLVSLENRLRPGESRALVIDLPSEPLPSEGIPPSVRKIDVVATRNSAGEFSYAIVPEDIETLDQLRGIVDAELEAHESRFRDVDAANNALGQRIDGDARALQERIVDTPALDDYVQQRGIIEAEEATIRSEMQASEAEIKRLEDSRVSIDAERGRADTSAKLPEQVHAMDDFHKTRKGLRISASSLIDSFGLATDIAEAPIQVREGIKVLPSAPSAAYVVEKVGDQIQILTPGDVGDATTPSAGFVLRWLADEAIASLTVGEAHAQSGGGTGYAPNFETDWNGEYHLAFLRTAANPDNDRDGFLVREHPFGLPDAKKTGAGFPSTLIAQDSRGRVYLNNANSNEQYGGRLFRFAGDPVAREHVGVVNYYSMDLGYGRPATPVAMAVGDWYEGDRVVEDLFVANIDRGGYFDAGIQATNRILRVPVHYKETNPDYPANRIVGQPYAEHPDFQFTGPSDLVVDRRTAIEDGVARNLYLSDEEHLFVIEPGEPGGSGVVKKLVDLPGRRWSGLAVDSAGHLLFADWRAGEVFLMTAEEIDAIRSSGAPIASETELNERAYLIKEGLDGPTDIELDSLEARYVVSTDRGFQPFNFSVIGRLGPDTTDVRLVVGDQELPTTYRSLRGNVFIAGFTSEGALGKEARLKVRRIDPATGRAYWDLTIVRLALFGASVMPEPL